MIVSRQLYALGITENHLSECALPLTEEAITLIEAGLDIFERELLMTPSTYDAWISMRNAAQLEHIEIMIVSAFRSVEYQCELISRKLASGRSIDEILKVNAIPGYSEHHSGCALDLTTTDCPPLEIEFEQTPAYAWLTRNAAQYGFTLSYPKHNTKGIDYEPWHWAYHGD